MVKKGKRIKYSTKIIASKVLGFPIDRSLNNVTMLQNNYQLPQTQQPQQRVPRASKLKEPNIMSEQDRLSFRK